MEQCPCGTGNAFADCCQPYINGERLPETAEQLMRARYSAYTTAQTSYILDSTHPDHRADHDAKATKKWAEQSRWQGLEIISTTAGGPDDDTGEVEFIARYIQKGGHVAHHERATFTKQADRWYFEDGVPIPPEQVVRQGPKVGRNDPCPCGSGKKYKKCCANH